MFAVICVGLLTVVEFTVIPDPMVTELVPLMKPVPVKTTSTVCSLLATFGARLASVGAGFVTVNARFTLAPPPGAAFVTEKLRLPVAAAEPMVMLAVICVG